MFEKFFDCGAYDNWGEVYTHIHGPTMDKVASQSCIPASLLTVIEKLQPRPEGRYILLNALGAYEYWSSNNNGDAFPEWSLKSMLPPPSVQRIIDTKVKERLPAFMVPPCTEYGTGSFVQHAKVYQHHVNKDPNIACGDVVAAAYNDLMHRTELIVFIYQQRAADIVKQIDDGIPIPFSMGAKLPFDVCSICSNVARNRAEYCDHLKNELRQFYPDGRKVFSYNYFPRFFDISKVSVPADKSAWMLKKIASAETVAPIQKAAQIEKRTITTEQQDLGSAPINPKLLNFIRSSGWDGACSDEPLDPQLAMLKNQFSVKDILSSMLTLGMLPSSSEINTLTGGDDAAMPNSLDVVNPNRRLIMILSKHVPSRSLLDPYFTKRAAYGKKRSKPSKAHKKFASLLTKVNYRDLVNTMEHNPSVALSLNSDALGLALFKSASTKEPCWLPFIVCCSIYTES